ncbi:glycogen synthase [Patescibacteria group bacterium]
MKVLLAASEVAPIVKMGGLGDVIGSLPKSLESLGIDADVIVPFYPTIKKVKFKLIKALEIEVPFDGESHTVEIFKTKLPKSNVDVLLPRSSKYFNIGGKSAFLNNASETEMYSFFCRVVVEYIKARFNTYDVIHCHDWHTGMVTHLLNEELHAERPGTLFTIHNLLYQGKGDPELVKDLGLNPGVHPLIDWDIQDGDISLLLQGVTTSDYVNTVSESYAEEIKTPEFGIDLTDVLVSRKDRLVGILNGIDYSVFPRDFNVDNWKTVKKGHKESLKDKLGLNIDGDKPIFGFISRLDPRQKGLDILHEAVPSIVHKGGQFVLLGTGSPTWEKKFEKLNSTEGLKGDVSCNIMFDVDLAREIYAASDFFLIPSKYEPCGLTQMISMWYGSLPIVRGVGGLKDTVKHGHNGFVFEKYTSKQLVEAIFEALKVWESGDYEQMVKFAMKEDFGWEVSAKKYKDLYNKIIELSI